MGVLCATAENSGLLKEDKNTAVKLKAVPTTSGCLTSSSLINIALSSVIACFIPTVTYAGTTCTFIVSRQELLVIGQHIGRMLFNTNKNEVNLFGFGSNNKETD